MVLALLAGRKSQTRRAVTKGNSAAGSLALRKLDWSKAMPSAGPSGVGILVAPPLDDDDETLHRIWPRWEVGDLLWVRETWAQVGGCDPGLMVYRADYPACVPPGYENVPPASDVTWRPSIHMARALSRITLRLTEIRVERLQSISEADAIAEGCPAVSLHDLDCASTPPSQHYRDLWESINGKESWARNDWVWRIAFDCIRMNVDEVPRDD